MINLQRNHWGGEKSHGKRTVGHRRENVSRRLTPVSLDRKKFGNLSKTGGSSQEKGINHYGKKGESEARVDLEKSPEIPRETGRNARNDYKGLLPVSGGTPDQSRQEKTPGDRKGGKLTDGRRGVGRQQNENRGGRGKLTGVRDCDWKEDGGKRVRGKKRLFSRERRRRMAETEGTALG